MADVRAHRQLGGLLLAGSLVAFVAAPRLVPLIAPGFDDAQQALVVELSRLMLVSPICFTLGAVAISLLHSDNRFGAAAAAPIVYNVSIIAAAVFLAPLLGVHALALGVAAGAVGFLGVQLLPLIGHPIFSRAGRLPLRNAEVWHGLRLLGPRVVGLSGV